MYRSFYSLSGHPFSKDLDADKAYASKPFTEAQSRLDYLRKTRGIGLVIGEPGAGKTFALRAFTSALHPSRFRVIYYPLSTGTVMDFYRGLAYGLGEEPKSRKEDVFRQIQHAVERMYREQRVTPVFILDEMQMAKDVFLSDLCLLFNFAMDSDNPFILILAGLPYLRDRLGLNQNRPLAQRIVMRHQVEALDKEGVISYMEHHLQLAGAKHPIFTPAAMEAIALRSQGWPRRINSLATLSLL